MSFLGTISDWGEIAYISPQILFENFHEMQKSGNQRSWGFGERVLKLDKSHLGRQLCAWRVQEQGRHAHPLTDRSSLWSGVPHPSRLSEFDVRRPCIQPTNPPGAKSDYGICSLLIWPAPTSSFLSSRISPLKLFTNQVSKKVVSMAVPPRLCTLTKDISGAQGLGQPLRWRKLNKVNDLWGVSLGSQPASHPRRHL